MVTLSNNVKRGCGVDKVQVLNEVLTLPRSLHPPSMLQNPGGAIKLHLVDFKVLISSALKFMRATVRAII